MAAITAGDTTAQGGRATSGGGAAGSVAQPGAFLFFATWALIGLFLDGWSHRTDKPESFFSPWHAVLYSGALAGIAWYGFVALRAAPAARAEAAHGRSVVRRRVGRDEQTTRVGMALFLLGGAADAAWHEVFGVEADLGALLSPTHLLLMLGGIGMGAGQLLGRWQATADDDARGIRQTAYGSGLALGIVSFFTMFLSPFVVRRLPVEEDPQGGLVSGVLFTTVLLLVPLLLLARRWPLPAGAALAVVAPTAVGMAILEGGRSWPLCLAPLAAGAFAEVVLARAPGRRLTAGTARLLGLGVPVALWGAFYLAHAALGTMRFAAEVWTGSIVLACVVGVATSLLAVPPASGAARTTA